jgi:hypothetical protein
VESDLQLTQLLERDARVEANETAATTPKGGNSAGSASTTALEIACECGREECPATIRLSLRQYRALRRAGGEVAITPGHQLANDALQRVSDRYWVVRRPYAGS